MVLECSGCTKYECKKIRENGGYKYWYCLLEYVYGYDYRSSKAVEKELIKAAIEFVHEYQFVYRGGLCLCDAPYGNYIWHFAVRLKQYRLWDLKEFRQGYYFGLNPKEPYRDANPYLEPERASTWDCGYVLGLSKRR